LLLKDKAALDHEREMGMKIVLLVAMLMLSLSTRGLAQAAERVSVTFATQDDDKAGSTQVQDHLVCDNHDVATLICCNAGRDIDRWNVNTTTARDMTIVEHFAKGRLAGCHFVFGMKAAGSDTWKVIPSLTVYYDGSRVDWHFPYTVLKSDNAPTSKTFDLPHQ
jgi:hypothetical protein